MNKKASFARTLHALRMAAVVLFVRTLCVRVGQLAYQVAELLVDDAHDSVRGRLANVTLIHVIDELLKHLKRTRSSALKDSNADKHKGPLEGIAASGRDHSIWER